jgi:hypothetical protein
MIQQILLYIHPRLQDYFGCLDYYLRIAFTQHTNMYSIKIENMNNIVIRLKALSSLLTRAIIRQSLFLPFYSYNHWFHLSLMKFQPVNPRIEEVYQNTIYTTYDCYIANSFIGDIHETKKFFEIMIQTKMGNNKCNVDKKHSKK